MRGIKVDPDYTEDWPGRTTDSGVGKRSQAGLSLLRDIDSLTRGFCAIHGGKAEGQAAKCRIYSESDWLQETIGTVGIVLVISYPASLALFHVGRVGRYSGMN